LAGADVIAWRLIRSIFRELEEDRSREIHVTDLVYECPRRAYYEKVYGYGVTSLQSAFVLWIGKKLHETGMDGCDHEVAVEGELGGVRVVGSIDELCEGGDLIVDKKTTRRIPRQPHEHHVLQVLIYALLLQKMGRRVPRRGAIVYIDVANAETKSYEFPITATALASVEKEVAPRARELATALATGKPPKPRPGWLCNYCSYVRRCALDGE